MENMQIYSKPDYSDKLSVLLKCVIIVIFILPLGLKATESAQPLAWWTFDIAKDSTVSDQVSGSEDVIRGNFKYVTGVNGLCLKLDGFTTEIIRQAENAPVLKDKFTMECWIALGAYPWNWCPVVSQRSDSTRGYFFGIGPKGQLSLQLALDGQWQSCTSGDLEIPLRKWTHIAASYDENHELNIYINGKSKGKLEVRGQLTPAVKSDLFIGINQQKMKPSNIHRPFGTKPGWFSLDGVLDELKIYTVNKSSQEISQVYQDARKYGDSQRCDPI